jgi:hypothetical protein
VQRRKVQIAPFITLQYALRPLNDYLEVPNIEQAHHVSCS